MSKVPEDHIKAVAERVLELAEEVEASGEAMLGGTQLDAMRAALHEWVDSVTAVVAMPAFGRTTLIHNNGRQSNIASSDLAYTISGLIAPKQA
jgi:hypothetical protein